MILLALCIARLDGAIGKFIEQQLDMVKVAGEIGGNSIGFRSTILAAFEAGYLDWCHKALTKNVLNAQKKGKGNGNVTFKKNNESLSKNYNSEYVEQKLDNTDTENNDIKSKKRKLSKRWSKSLKVVRKSIKVINRIKCEVEQSHQPMRNSKSSIF